MKMTITALLAAFTLNACAATPPPVEPQSLTLDNNQQARLRTLLELTPSSPFTVDVKDQDGNGQLSVNDIAVVYGGIANAEVSRRVLGTADIATINSRPTVGSNNALSRLQAAESKWQETRPEAYTYTLQRGCFCMPEITKPMEIRVKQDSLISARVMPEGTPLPGERMNFALTIDKLFQTIHDAIDQKAATVEVTYDQHYGFPTHIFIDRNKMMADEELSLNASNLQPVKTAK